MEGLPPLKAVLVVWIDSEGSGKGWQNAEELLDTPPAPLVSVGLLLQDDPQFVTLVQSYNRHGNTVSEDITIPRFAIRSMYTLKTPAKAQRHLTPRRPIER